MVSRKGNEEPLKALVFADHCGAERSIDLSFGKPLLNVPILSWQLSALARYGVKEAVVLSSKPLDNVYADPLRRMKVTLLANASWTGEGDALRDVEQRDGMRPVDDFILVRCGTIFNVDVSKLVAEHKKRREVDRNWLITTVFRKGAGSAGSGLRIALDAKTNILVKYLESLSDADAITVDVKGEHTGLRNGGILDVCSDVLDVGLDVCAPDFMIEFRENFYYDSVRAYITEKLRGGDAEVFGNLMYARFLQSSEGEYASRITSLASYAQVTSDALNGWLCPVTDDCVVSAGRCDSSHDFSSDYVVERSVIGANVKIAVGSTVVESVVGNGVTIGSDVTIVRSAIMDGTVIVDRADIEKTIIGENCTIREESKIPEYCFIDNGVCIGYGCPWLRPRALISLRDQEDFENLEDTDEDEDDGEADGDSSADIEVHDVSDDDDNDACESTSDNVDVNSGEKAKIDGELDAEEEDRDEDDENGGDDQNVSEEDGKENGKDKGDIVQKGGDNDREEGEVVDEENITKKPLSREEEWEAMCNMPEHERKLGFAGKGHILRESFSLTVDAFFVPKLQRIQVIESDNDDDDDEFIEASDDDDEDDNGEDVDELANEMAEVGIEYGNEDEDDNRRKMFFEEAFDMMERAFNENITLDNLTTEINSLKMAYQCTFAEVVAGTVAGIVLTVQSGIEEKKLYGAILGGIKKYLALILKFGKEGDEIHQLQVAEMVAMKLNDFPKSLLYVFKVMYDQDIVEEEGILTWASAKRKRVEAGEESKAVLIELQPFLDWLEQDPEDEEEEDSDE